MVDSFARQEAYDGGGGGGVAFSCRAEKRMKKVIFQERLFLIQCRVNNNMLAPVFSDLI